MPDQEIADAIETLLDRAGVSAERRALLYRRLIERQLIERGARPRTARDRTGSEHQPLEERDYLRKSIDDYVGWGPDGTRPTAPARAPARQNAAITARVQIFDLNSTIAKMKQTIASTLERHLNGLGRGTNWAGFLAQHGIAFKVTYASSEPPAVDKAAMRPLDYPVYFIDEQTTSVATLLRIMDEYMIPTFTPGTSVKVRDYVQETWRLRLRGVTVPPGKAAATPYRKCIFFHGHHVAREANGNGVFCVNAILHELGHVHNITEPGQHGAHPRDGSVMNPGLSAAAMSIEPLGYNASHLERIIVQIGRLWRAQQSF